MEACVCHFFVCCACVQMQTKGLYVSRYFKSFCSSRMNEYKCHFNFVFAQQNLLVDSFICTFGSITVCLMLQMVKTTGGPAFGASVSSPALTTSAVSLLQDNLDEEEKQLWTSLGPNWTLPWSVSSITSTRGPSLSALVLCNIFINFPSFS